VRTEIAVALIESLPSVLAIGAVALLAIVFRRTLEERVLPRLSGVVVFGVSLSFLKQELDEVATERLHTIDEESAKAGFTISEGDKWSALRRAQHVSAVIRGARLLWVDDEPRNNRGLVTILRSLGAEVDQVRATDDALKLLHRHHYDVVISDIRRPEGDDAGIAMVSRMKDEGVFKWTIFYVLRKEDGVPAHAFNITNRPDHLLHYVMDALERERWPDTGSQ